MKYPLADYALTPTVAIIDPALTGKMPGFLAADSGFDALTHATEAYVSRLRQRLHRRHGAARDQADLREPRGRR